MSQFPRRCGEYGCGTQLANGSGMSLGISETSSTLLRRSKRHVSVLRSVFRRQHETVTFELGLNEDDSAYELRITPPRNPVGVASELFDDATSAFQRHAAIERTLVQTGWSLESFESDRVRR
jgi:hypothetical protein